MRYAGYLKKKLPDDYELQLMMAELGRWLPMSEGQIIARAIEKYHAHHRNKRSDQIKPIQKQQMLIDQNHLCYYCQKYIISKTSNVDHKTPLARGGTGDKDNLCATCKECNTLKETMTEMEFRAFMSPQKTKIGSLISSLKTLV